MYTSRAYVFNSEDVTRGTRSVRDPRQQARGERVDRVERCAQVNRVEAQRVGADERDGLAMSPR